MTDKPQFELIQGDWVSCPEWLDLPPVIRARHPTDQGRFCKVRVGRQDAVKAAEARRRQPAYEFWSVLNGRVPPVPGSSSDDPADLSTLSAAHACFRGVKRPIGADGHGEQTIAYVLKPKFFYSFEPRPPIAFSVKREVAPDLVFVAYVRLDDPMSETVPGLLTHWHFVEADPRDTKLPLEFDNRYLKRLW